jgi:V8-like Glu-specific endopeptidase
MKLTAATTLLFLTAQTEAMPRLTPKDFEPDNAPQSPTPWDREMQHKIVGGTDHGGPNPFQVLFSPSSSGACCGGSLIAPNVVLTAAHCNPCGNAVHVGRYDLTNPSEDFETIQVVEKVPHPNYNPSTIQYDYMVMRLATPMTKGQVIAFDDGSLSPSYSSGKPLDLTGWGQISGGQGGPLPQKLQHGEFPFITKQECAQAWGSYITDQTLCVYESSSSACMGDSGGPLYDETSGNPVQVGIVSFGTQSCSGAPGVFANVANQSSWIQGYVDAWSGNGTTPPPPPPPSGGSCTDWANWTDSYGDGCEWYEANDSEGCPSWTGCCDAGNGTPDQACCHCGGGNTSSTPTPPAPTPPPPTPTPPPPTPTPPPPSPPAGPPSSGITSAIDLIDQAVVILEGINV